MSPLASLLVVHHSPTRSMQMLLDAVVAGAHEPAIEGVQVAVRPALDTTADDVLTADGYVLLTTANFGYMSGAMKHFFDTTFLAVGGSLTADGSAGDSPGGTAGRPYGLVVHGRFDTTGAVRSVQSIVTALRWRQSAETIEVMGEVARSDIDACYDLGGTLAAIVSG